MSATLAPSTSVCRWCGAPIRWARTRRGRAMPLDVEPCTAGNVTVDDHGLASVHPHHPVDGELRYLPHFATCPHYTSSRPLTERDRAAGAAFFAELRAHHGRVGPDAYAR